MTKLWQVLLICYICLIAFLVIGHGQASDDSQLLKRPRRYLSFKNMSKFFMRLNFRANMVPWNQIFAQAFGFRLNWDEPPESFHPYHHIHRRTVYTNLELLLDSNGINGFHCIRRAICEMEMIAEPREMYHRILKMVFRNQSSLTSKWHNDGENDCRLSISLCPLSVLDVSRYTDII